MDGFTNRHLILTLAWYNAMPRLMKYLLIGSASVLCLGIAGLLVLSVSSRAAVQRAVDLATDPLAPRAGFELMQIPSFAGKTQEDKPVSETIFDGRVTVLSFIFTHCPLACPAMTSTVKGVADELKADSVRFVTISLDPGNDTPARLKEWGENYKADFARWTFINAGPGVHKHILRDVFQEHLELDPSFQIPLDGDKTMDNIVHPTVIYLIGPDRKVIDRFASKRAEEVSSLVQRARMAATSLGSKPAKPLR